MNRVGTIDFLSCSKVVHLPPPGCLSAVCRNQTDGLTGAGLNSVSVPERVTASCRWSMRSYMCGLQMTWLWITWRKGTCDLMHVNTWVVELGAKGKGGFGPTRMRMWCSIGAENRSTGIKICPSATSTTNLIRRDRELNSGLRWLLAAWAKVRPNINTFGALWSVHCIWDTVRMHCVRTEGR